MQAAAAAAAAGRAGHAATRSQSAYADGPLAECLVAVGRAVGS